MPAWNIPALLFAVAFHLPPGHALLVDSVSAWLVLVYVLWVIGYDIPWSYRLWRLNPPLAQPARGRL